MRIPAMYDVEEWEDGWAVVRDGLDLRDRRETPRRRLAVVALYSDQVVAESVAFVLNNQRGNEIDPPGVVAQVRTRRGATVPPACVTGCEKDAGHTGACMKANPDGDHHG